MDSEKPKGIQTIHLILGIFFTIAGLLTLVNVDYIFSIWVISLGLLFLFDSIKEMLKLNPNSLKVIHFIIGAIVLISGIASLSVKFGII